MRPRKLKKQIKKEAEDLLKERRAEICPALPAKKQTVRVKRAVVLSVALIAALLIPFAAVMLNKPAPEAPPAAGTEESAQTEQTAPGAETVPTEPTEPTVSTEPAIPSEPTDPAVPVTSAEPSADTSAAEASIVLPRVPKDGSLPFDLPVEYRMTYDVRRAYTPDQDGQDALKRLIEDDGKTFTKLDHLISRFCWNEIDGVNVEDTTPFICWGGWFNGRNVRNFYYFFEVDALEMGLEGEDFRGSADEDYRFVFEFWYKRAGSDEDYRGVCTSPDSMVLPYIYGYMENWGKSPVVFRVPTYNEGIRDLHTDNGAPVDYEFIIVIRDTYAKEDRDVAGWGKLTITIDEQYEEHLQQAFDEGLLELPQ